MDEPKVNTAHPTKHKNRIVLGQGEADGVARVKLWLKVLFGFIFVFMVALTVRTSLRESLWAAWPGFAKSPWAMATLYDAYFGFITFYCWLAWRERSVLRKGLWLVLVMGLGNIAMSAYVLLQLLALKPEEGVEELFRRKAA